MLWVAGQIDGAARIWALNTTADPGDVERMRPSRVGADWLRGRRVTALKLAGDGQRVAVVSTEMTGADPQIDVAGVIRSSSGVPERLAEPLRVAPTLTLVRDLVWVDQTTLAVLGRISRRSAVRVWTAEVGGALQAAELSEASTAQSITTTNGERGLVVTTDKGRILLRAGSSWLEVAEGTDFAVPAT
jgi:hypothetical protein